MALDGFGRHTPTLSNTRTVRALSIDDALIPHVSDAIAQLTFENQWVEFGDDIGTVVDAAIDALDSWYKSNMFIGQLAGFLGDLPLGWLALDGATHNKTAYPELWGALDDEFKDATTFTLPDLSGLFLVGISAVTYDIGSTGGLDSVVLSIAELPSHSHSYIPPVPSVDSVEPGVPIPSVAIGTAVQTGSVGSGEEHENRPPYFAVRYGIFSGRIA